MVKNVLINSVIFIVFFFGTAYFFKKNNESKGLTKVAVENYIIRFDTLKQYSMPVREIHLKNTGKEVLVIDSIRKSCDCVDIRYSRKLIRPKGGDTLFVSINTSLPDFVNESVLIYCNAPQSPLWIRVVGYIVPTEQEEVVVTRSE